MSSDRCQSCRNVGFCTFPRSRVITECDEFEEMDVAPAFDWDLQELLRLWALDKDPRGSD
jgi:hypothetical protein